MVVKFILFGDPCVLNRVGEIIFLKNKKEMAVLAYLSRQRGRRATRKEIGELLWGGVEAKKQQASVRQAIKNLRGLEKQVAVPFLEINAQVIGLIHHSIQTDVDEVYDALSKAPEYLIAKAGRLYSERFLEGIADNAPKFKAWKQIEFQSIRNRFLERAAARLSQIRPEDRNSCFPKLARFILKVDPSNEWAHQRLIQHFMFADRHELAKRQYKSCSEELRLRLRKRPTLETRSLLDLKSVTKTDGLITTTEYSPPPAFRSEILPSIFIVPYEDKRTSSSAGICNEYFEQLTRNRDFVVRGAEDLGFEKAADPKSVGIDDASGGEFVLNMHENPISNGVMIELKSRVDGKTIFVDTLPVVDEMVYEDKIRLVSQSINEVQNKIRRFYNNNEGLSKTVYGRISVIYELMKRFDTSANMRALQILSEIEEDCGATSITNSFKASIYLKQRLFLQDEPGSNKLVVEAKKLAIQAVELDPWHELNQRYLGFALCHLGDYESGKQRLLRGQSMTYGNSQQSMATAETCAFAGDISNAFKFSEDAFRFSSDLPRYFYGYMANIQFAAGNFEEAASLASRAPAESMDSRAVRIASLWEIGKLRAAKSEFQESIKILSQQDDNRSDLDVVQVCNWFAGLNQYANPKTKALFQNNLHGAATSR